MSNIRKLRITVEGKVYDVAVEVLDEPGAALPASQAGPSVAPIIAAPVAAPAAAVSSEAPGEVRAAVAGKVSQVHVKPGDTVHVNDKLVTLEAMKMFVDVCSPASGKVAEVFCAAGDAVTDGAVLVKLA
jgi:biotin carboxyl carrier protein